MYERITKISPCPSDYTEDGVSVSCPTCGNAMAARANSKRKRSRST